MSNLINLARSTSNSLNEKNQRWKHFVAGKAEPLHVKKKQDSVQPKNIGISLILS